MKQIWKYAMMAVVALGSVACSGTTDNGGDESPVSTDGPFTISVDKESIEANGKDIATFSILNGEGKDITADVIRNTSFTNVTTNQRLDYGTCTFSSIIDGEYVFKATVATSESVSDTENTVKVKVQNRAKYEKYKQKVGIYKCTGTWCGYCPAMTTALHAVREDLQDNMVVFACHSGDNFSIDMGSGIDLVNYFYNAGFNVPGLPTNIYKARDVNAARNSLQIEAIIEEYMLEHPTTCGIKIASAKREGTTITVDCALTTTTAGKYDLGCALLVDNQYYSGGSEPSNVYSNIVLSTTPNINGTLSSNYFTMEADQEQTHTFTISNISDTFKLEDLRVVVFALKELEDDTTIMDNCQVCPVGGSADYELN